MRTSGGRVACGGSKCSSIASLRLARASSSVSPWLATSSSKHWETYHFPSRQTVAANGRFMILFFHRQGCLTRLLRFESIFDTAGATEILLAAQHASRRDAAG